MPITQSAKKEARKSKRRNLRNEKTNRDVKRLVKQLKKLVSGKKFDEAKQLLPRVYKALDKAAKTKFIKKNTASRLKSRLTQLIAKSSKASS